VQSEVEEGLIRERRKEREASAHTKVAVKRVEEAHPIDAHSILSENEICRGRASSLSSRLIHCFLIVAQKPCILTIRFSAIIKAE
jgi:hypothetical protein